MTQKEMQREGRCAFFPTQPDLFGVTIKPSFSLPCLPGSVRENKREDIPVDENDDR